MGNIGWAGGGGVGVRWDPQGYHSFIPENFKIMGTISYWILTFFSDWLKQWSSG